MTKVLFEVQSPGGPTWRKSCKGIRGEGQRVRRTQLGQAHEQHRRQGRRHRPMGTTPGQRVGSARRRLSHQRRRRRRRRRKACQERWEEAADNKPHVMDKSGDACLGRLDGGACAPSFPAGWPPACMRAPSMVRGPARPECGHCYAQAGKDARGRSRKERRRKRWTVEGGQEKKEAVDGGWRKADKGGRRARRERSQGMGCHL